MQITSNESRNDLLTSFGKETLKDRYLLPGESYQDMFIRVSKAYADDQEHAQRLYDYMSKLWFMPSTPILSNGGTNRGLPISCFLNEVTDNLKGIVDLWSENVWLASKGGGIGSYWGNIRGIGEKVGGVGKTSGVIPFIHVMDSLTLAISQGSLRRGSAAVYLPVDHPEIEEFVEIRRTTGGDPNRKALNLHHAVVISDKFMQAVKDNLDWNLLSPFDQSIQKTVKARDLWIRLLTARVETGEPYFLFIDTINKVLPPWHEKKGLKVKTSNLCCEICLPTTDKRTAVCCLSSLNLEYYKDWKDHPLFIEDVMRFLDNVLQNFIDKAPDSMSRATYSAQRERSVGLGVMGFHSFLQKNKLPFESALAKVWNIQMFKHIEQKSKEASIKIAQEKGPCPDAAEEGYEERFSYRMAVAPTASISIITGGTSPGIEPIVANSFSHKTLSGTFTVRNIYLSKLLESKNKTKEELEDIWVDIAMHKGSVAHLDFLTPQEKDVFKTAFEIDQRWVIDHAADRQPFIDQSQSLNLFIPADIHKRDLHQLHMRAWEKGLKGLYYCRSMSVQRGESTKQAYGLNLSIKEDKNNDYEECLACQ